MAPDDIDPGRLGDRYCERCELVRKAHVYSVRAGEAGFSVEAVDLACGHTLDPDESLTAEEKRDLDQREDVRLEMRDDE